MDRPLAYHAVSLALVLTGPNCFGNIVGYPGTRIVQYGFANEKQLLLIIQAKASEPYYDIIRERPSSMGL